MRRTVCVTAPLAVVLASGCLLLECSSAQPTRAAEQDTTSEQKTRQTRQRIHERILQKKNVPVDFFGRVVDQNSNALAGVTVTARVRHWDADSIGASIPITAQTDKQGCFRARGATGDMVDIEEIKKQGYELEPGVRSYTAQAGTPADPIFFKMWDTNIHQTLVTGEKSFQIVPDGRPYVIDLARGTISESGPGDLRAWVKRPDPIPTKQQYDWSCGIDIPGGGLLEETNLAGGMYEAPMEGYAPSFHFDQKVGSGWGDVTPTKRFFLALKGGKEYGKVSVELYAHYNQKTPGLIRIQYTLNPSGSRILR